MNLITFAPLSASISMAPLPLPLSHKRSFDQSNDPPHLAKKARPSNPRPLPRPLSRLRSPSKDAMMDKWLGWMRDPPSCGCPGEEAKNHPCQLGCVRLCDLPLPPIDSKIFGKDLPFEWGERLLEMTREEEEQEAAEDTANFLIANLPALEAGLKRCEKDPQFAQEMADGMNMEAALQTTYPFPYRKFTRECKKLPNATHTVFFTLPQTTRPNQTTRVGRLTRYPSRYD